MNASLHNRLAVHACHDLAKVAPKSYVPLNNWLQQCGFWLAELAACEKTPDQTQFMVGFLGLALTRENRDFSLPQACQTLHEHMTLHQLTRPA